MYSHLMQSRRHIIYYSLSVYVFASYFWRADSALSHVFGELKYSFGYTFKLSRNDQRNIKSVHQWFVHYHVSLYNSGILKKKPFYCQNLNVARLFYILTVAINAIFFCNLIKLTKIYKTHLRHTFKNIYEHI